MKIRIIALAAAALALAAACDQAPIAPASANGSSPAMNVNQAPVANIKLVSKKPISTDPYGSEWFFRYNFSASGSYDPEGGAVTYYWASSCAYVPNGNGFNYTVDVQPYDTCLVDLYVTDSLGAMGHDQVTVDSYGNVTY